MNQMEQGRRGVVGEPDLLGGLPSSTELVERALGVASTAAPVLLVGEMGSGRTNLARRMHEASGRRGVFLELDCSVLAPDIIERELFGTEAEPQGSCVLERADRGTLVLRNLASLSLSSQQHLLESIEEKSIRACGATESRPVDARLIVIDEGRLEERVRLGSFHRSLLSALAQVTLVVPALRERRADLPLLVHRLLASLRERTGVSAIRVHPEALSRLQGASWLRNLEELVQVVTHAAVVAGEGEILVEHLPGNLGVGLGPAEHTPQSLLCRMPYREAKERALEEFESAYFAALLERTGGNVSEAARQAGLDRSNFRRALRRARQRAAHGSDFGPEEVVEDAGSEPPAGAPVEESGTMERPAELRDSGVMRRQAPLAKAGRQTGTDGEDAVPPSRAAQG